MNNYYRALGEQYSTLHGESLRSLREFDFKPLSLKQSNMYTNQILAQQLIGDYDVIGDLRSSYDNFIESGQVWALLIGLFFGYIFKSFTSY